MSRLFVCLSFCNRLADSEGSTRSHGTVRWELCEALFWEALSCRGRAGRHLGAQHGVPIAHSLKLSSGNRPCATADWPPCCRTLGLGPRFLGPLRWPPTWTSLLLISKFMFGVDANPMFDVLGLMFPGFVFKRRTQRRII